MKVRVLLIDDGALVRSSLRMTLSSSEELEVVGEADDGAGGRGRAHSSARRRPDGHPDARNGRHRCHSRHPPARLPAARNRPNDVPRRRTGHERAPGRGRRAPPKRHPTQRDCERSATRRLRRSDPPPRSPARSSPTSATTRSPNAGAPPPTGWPPSRNENARVANAVASGASNAGVAASLFRSEATVKAHVSRLLTKLEVANRVHISILVHDVHQ